MTRHTVEPSMEASDCLKFPTRIVIANTGDLYTIQLIHKTGLLFSHQERADVSTWPDGTYSRLYDALCTFLTNIYKHRTDHGDLNDRQSLSTSKL